MGDSCLLAAVKGMLKSSPFFTVLRNVVLHLLLFSVSRALWTFYTDLFLPLILILHSLLSWFSRWKWSLLLVSESSLYDINNVLSLRLRSPLGCSLYWHLIVLSPVPAPEAGPRQPGFWTADTSTRHQGERRTGFCRGGGRKGAGEGGAGEEERPGTHTFAERGVW